MNNDGTVDFGSAALKVDAANPVGRVNVGVPTSVRFEYTVGNSTYDLLQVDQGSDWEDVVQCGSQDCINNNLVPDPGDSITLEHESGNRNDKNAIRVLDASGRQMGHLPREKAATVMLWYREGSSPIYSAIVENVERWDGGGVPHLRLVVKQPSAREDKIIAVLREAGVENPTDYLPRKTLCSKPVFKFGPKNPKPKARDSHQKTESGYIVLLALALIACVVMFLWV